MTDRELDRRLAAAFDVDHSADFLARVRTVIATEPMPTRWRLSWSFAAAGTALAIAAAIAAIVGSLAGERGGPTRAPVDVSHREAVAVPQPVERPRVEVPTVIAGASPSNIVPTRLRVRSISEPPITSQFPDVLVSPEDARGLGLLIRRAQAASVPTELPTDDLSTSEALTLPRIEISPLAVEPLPQVARLEQGDRP